MGASSCGEGGMKKDRQYRREASKVMADKEVGLRGGRRGLEGSRALSSGFTASENAML